MMNTLISNLTLAVPTALLTVFFSLWRFRSEKWWEIRVKTYKDIIQILYSMKVYMDESNEMYIAETVHVGGSGYNEDKFNKQFNTPQAKANFSLMKKNHDKSLSEINKMIDIGSFIISNKALNRLLSLKNTYHTEPSEDEDINYFLEDSKKMIDSCLSDIIAIAKSELGSWSDKYIKK